MSTLCTWAQTDPINDALREIINHSPDLQSERVLINAQQAENSDENALSNPEVAVGRVWGRHGIGNKLQIDVTQSFDWPGLYRARTLANREGLNAAEMEIAGAALEKALEAKLLMLELVYVRHQLEIIDSLKSNIESMVQYSDQGFREGYVNILDNRKIKFELYEINTKHASLHSREIELESQLDGMAPDVKINLSGITSYPIESLLDVEEYATQIGQFDPEILAKKFSSSQEDLNARVATQSRFPSFSLGYQHQAEMGDRFNGFTASMTLPVFENRHARAAALSRKESADLAIQSLTVNKLSEVRNDLQQMQTWRAEIENYLKVFGDNEYPRLLKLAYEGKEISAHEYFSETNYYQECALSFLEAEYNYNCALARLNKYQLLKLWFAKD